MRFDFVCDAATFLDRPNRFRVVARLHSTGEAVSAHCADPGRLAELLMPGVTVHVSPALRPGRKTAYDLRFVEHPVQGQLISLDTRLPNAIFAEGMAAGRFAPFADVGYGELRSEVNLPARQPGMVHSRIDFRLEGGPRRACWIEVKSVTLVEAGCALFPDAPTLRGRRHLLELTELVRSGDRAAVVFIIQRPDADRFAPNWATDPGFAAALAQAHDAGVELYAYTCSLTVHEVALGHPVWIDLRKG